MGADAHLRGLKGVSDQILAAKFWGSGAGGLDPEDQRAWDPFGPGLATQGSPQPPIAWALARRHTFSPLVP